MNNLGTKRLKAAIAVLALYGLVACGGSGGGGMSAGASAGTTVISGVVSDEAIVGATVTAISLDTSAVLGSAKSGTDGIFSINASTSQLGTGYALKSTGGTMSGLQFSGNLSAIYAATANTQQANLTLVTTALAEAANSTTQFTGTVLEKHEAIKSNAIARGLIGTDYNLVEPSGTMMADARTRVATGGLPLAIGGLVELIDKKRTGSGSGCNADNTQCWQDIGSLGEAVTLAVQGATVGAPAGTVVNCRVVASFDSAKQTLKMSVEYIPSDTANSTPASACRTDASKQITLALPATFAAQAPDACLEPALRASAMQNCVTIGSAISPSYFVIDGGYSHRTDKNTHQTKPTAGRVVTLSRSYGAVLSSSDSPSTGLAESQWAGKTAVVFVHGFSLGSAFGGDDGTWGKLPNLLTSWQPGGSISFVALNFQWRTDASYLTVASELAKAVDYAYQSTGNKVHIVAHSFGGVLARVMLQNLNGNTASSAAKVATLVTVGTPHSGINNTGTLSDMRTVEGVALPHGWGSHLTDKLCGQISCYQSGLNASVAQWALNDLSEASGIPNNGYITARLYTTRNQLPQGLKALALIGQIIDNNAPKTFGADDGLIAYYGQRFIPQTGRSALLSDTPEGGATVTERILGLATGVNAFPNDPVGSIVVTAAATRSAIPNPVKAGYKHSSVLATLVTGGTDAGVFNSEVNVPSSCGSATTCDHDTWVDLKEFLSGILVPSTPVCSEPQVLQNGQCVTPIAAPAAPTGVSATAGAGQVTITWTTVPGAASYNLYMASVAGVTKSNYSTLTGGAAITGVTHPYAKTGLANGTPYYFVLTAVNANGESTESNQVSITPQASGVSSTGRLNDTGITTSQCYEAGSNTLVACSSAGAIALSNAQDGMTGRDANATTNSDTDGLSGFSFSAVAGGCVQDNVTGLMWEIKTTDGGLRDMNKTYTNYGDNRAGDSSAYVAAINATNLCGYNDWRLPTIDELHSIVNYGIVPPGLTIDATWFPNTAGSSPIDLGYSSATPLASDPNNQKWGVYFSDGYIGTRSYPGYVRLVRAGGAPAQPRYIVSADGQEVTDVQTNLIWRRCAEGMAASGGLCTGTASGFTYEGALQRAAIQASSTGKAWRLPNDKELYSIVDKGRSYPAIDPIAFPDTPVSGLGWGFQSSTPSLYNVGRNSLVVEFTGGANTFGSRDASYSYYPVRLVRNGP